MYEITGFSAMIITLPAYLDPGTGSYALQILIAALLGAGFLIKTYWRNIKKGVRKLLKRDGVNSGDES